MGCTRLRRRTDEGFELELMARERTLREFVETKHREIVLGARTRIAEYLMAVYAQRNQPATDNFMILTDQGDLNPTVISRWRTHLERAGATSAVWMPWHRFAELSETDFSEGSGEIPALVLKADGLNPRVREAFSNASPGSMKEVAKLYAGLFGTIETQWQEVVTNAARAGTGQNHESDRITNRTES
jgi:hypothetical protein